MALEWSDADLTLAQICVKRTCYYGRDDEGRFVRITDLPKTDCSVRTVPIPNALLRPLRAQKKNDEPTWKLYEP